MRINDWIQLKPGTSVSVNEGSELAPKMRVLAFRGADVKVDWANYRGARYATWTPLAHLQKNYEVSKGQE
jgi:hypothetical protein